MHAKMTHDEMQGRDSWGWDRELHVDTDGTSLTQKHYTSSSELRLQGDDDGVDDDDDEEEEDGNSDNCDYENDNDGDGDGNGAEKGKVSWLTKAKRELDYFSCCCLCFFFILYKS